MSEILIKKLKCPEFWHPVNYFSELGHETHMFDFGTLHDFGRKTEKFRD